MRFIGKNMAELVFSTKNQFRGKSIEQLEKELKSVEERMKEARWEEEFERIFKEYKGEDEVVGFKDYLEIQGKERKKRYSSGFEKLDNLIGGFSEGDLITVTGPAGEGKTTFCQNLTTRLLKNGIKSLWFSYEIPAEQFIIKFGEEVPEGYLPKNLVSRSTTWIERKIVEAIKF